MIGIATALWLSKPLRYALVGLAMMAAYEGWKVHQQKLGAERVAAAIEKKTNEDARKADEVRDDTAAGKLTSRVRNPFERAASKQP